MARLIFKCPYLKPGTAVRRGNYVRYIATRAGVETFEPRRNYVEYMARRPNSHGLFSADDEPITLSRIADEAAAHPGNLWLPIISLRREDAERLGYDCAERWRSLLRSQSNELAAAMKIAPENFRWYAAYHDEGSHPHIHAVVWSTEPSEGFLTKKGIEQIKSKLAAQIFKDDLLHIYERQTEYRSELGTQSQRRMAELIATMQSGELHNDEIERLVLKLSERLRKLAGKKQYGYLPASDKAIVDAIVDELCKDERVAECYRLWCEARMDVLRTYRKNPPHPGALSKQPELKRIRNIVIELTLDSEKLKMKSEKLVEDGTLADDNNNMEAQATENPTHNATESDNFSFLPFNFSLGTRLLHSLGKLFEDNPPAPKHGSLTERKLLRKLRQKKIAQGHAENDRAQHYDMG